MNAAEAIGGFIVVVCTVVGLVLQVRKQVSDQKATEARAAAKLRRDTLIEGYVRRTAEVRTVINRVVDVLNGALGHSPIVDRQLNRAISILTDATEGEPDDITANPGT